MRALALAVLVLAACGPTAASVPAPRPLPATFTPHSFYVKVRGQGRPVIFIPGIACSGAVWDRTLGHLGDKVQAHVLTLAGFGGRPPISGDLLPQVRDELIRYIRDRKLERPIIVGHSVGGFVALWVAETAPDAVGGLVLVDGLPWFPGLWVDVTPDGIHDKAVQARDSTAALDQRAFMGMLKGFYWNQVQSEKDLEEIMAHAGESSPQTTAGVFYELMSTDLRPELGKITAPVLVIASDAPTADRAPRLVESWHKQIDPIPHHTLVVIKGSKHFVMFDDPAAFYGALDPFLAAPK